MSGGNPSVSMETEANCKNYPLLYTVATVKPLKIVEVNGAEASVLKTHLCKQSSRHKASYI